MPIESKICKVFFGKPPLNKMQHTSQDSPKTPFQPVDNYSMFYNTNTFSFNVKSKAEIPLAIQVIIILYMLCISLIIWYFVLQKMAKCIPCREESEVDREVLAMQQEQVKRQQVGEVNGYWFK